MLGREEIAARIPHAGNMVLLDRLHDWTETTVTCSTRSHLRPDNPLRSQDGLSAVCGVEYGAQAAALHGSLIGVASRAGMLASLRNLRLDVARLDAFESELYVSAEQIHREGQGAVYAFVLSADDKTLVTGQAAMILR